MSIRMDILNAINEGIGNSYDIIEKLSINPHSFHNSIRLLVNQGLLTSKKKSTFNAIIQYAITPLGYEIIEKKVLNQLDKSEFNTSPDYDAMCRHLRSDRTISNSKLIDLWNEKTDFYLPYLGDNKLRRFNTT